MFKKQRQENKSKAQAYLSINPYNQTHYLFDGKALKKLSSLKSKKGTYHISHLQAKDLIISTLAVSKNIPDEDLQDVIEIKAYEELDLDPAIEYKIDFIEYPAPIHEKERKFQVFITEPSLLRETFEPVVDKIGYIDAIVPAPLLFKTLYTNEILDTNEAHLFIYFQKDDAFLTLYNQGEMLYAKSLKYSFKEMAERLSELKGKDVGVEEVMRRLAQDGVKIEDLDELQFYMQLFSEVFMHINDILIYAKRAHNIDIIDKIFISSSVGSIKGIEEYAQTYLAQEAYEYAFDYGIATNEPYVEDLHYLQLLTAIDINEKGENYPNLTIFHRLPPLHRRPSGELLMILGVSLVLALAYPLYNVALTYKYKFDTAMMQKEYATVHAKKVALESRINALRKEIADLQNKIKLNKEDLGRRMAILEKIYDKKVNYIMKAETLADLTQDMVKYKIKTIAIENNESVFDFNVTAVDEKQITKFIKYITDTKYDKYNITTREINKTDENSTVYMSRLKVEVK